MASTQSATALLTEHLRYTPLTLIDDVINTVNELTNRAVDAAEEGLLAADPAALGFTARAAAEAREVQKDGDGNLVYPEAQKEIEEGVHQLETLLEANIDKNFDKFEIVTLRGILSVPDELVTWIRLAHYEHVGDSASIESLPTTDALQKLLEQVQETRKLQKALKATVTRNSRILERLKALTATTMGATDDRHSKDGPLAFLSQNNSATQLGLSSSLEFPPSEKKVTPLATNTSFALSQLPALQSLLMDLRPTLIDLNASIHSPAGEEDVAKERRHYVETQSRRAMERQGISTGNQTSESLGRIVSNEELAAIEALTDGLGS